MIQRPLIGLTTTRLRNSSGDPIFTINEPYTRSVSFAGGTPVLLPLDLCTEDLDVLQSRLDGILFTGGYDIDPQEYGNPHHPKVEGIDAERDRIETYLVRRAVDMGKPFFGICRGLQMINVALGGSLYEDLSDQFPGNVLHDNHDLPRDHLAHPVSVEKESRLAHILTGDQAWVNSLHHQGIRDLAGVLQPVTHSADGLIEAFELAGHPFGLAVQWHPEELQEHAAMRSLFQSFVQACQVINQSR